MQFARPQKLTVRLEDKRVHNEKFVQYKFELVEPFRLQFQAGQYVSLQVSDTGERRSYSICSKPGIDHGFELLVDVTPAGVGVQFLENLAFGQQVEALGPMGRFVVQVEPREPELYFIATGSGIAPFYGMITDLLQDKQDQRPIHLYWGLRHPQDMCWQEEFELLAEAFSQFHFEPILSQPPEGWPLSRGRVTDLLYAKDCPSEAGYYICGGTSMIQDVAGLLKEKNIAEEHIHFEKFY